MKDLMDQAQFNHPLPMELPGTSLRSVPHPLHWIALAILDLIPITSLTQPTLKSPNHNKNILTTTSQRTTKKS
jgi:hypothetical protein